MTGWKIPPIKNHRKYKTSSFKWRILPARSRVYSFSPGGLGGLNTPSTLHCTPHPLLLPGYDPTHWLLGDQDPLTSRRKTPRLPPGARWTGCSRWGGKTWWCFFLVAHLGFTTQQFEHKKTSWKVLAFKAKNLPLVKMVFFAFEPKKETQNGCFHRFGSDETTKKGAGAGAAGF